MAVEITELDNGLRVVTEQMDRVETVSIGAWVGVGARHEPANVNGVSHLLEHMVFKGTKSRTARAIAEEIEAVGGHMNAYTSREHTAYYAKMLKQDLSLAMDVIGGLVQHPTLDPEELEQQVMGEGLLYKLLPSLASKKVLEEVKTKLASIKQSDWAVLEQRVYRPVFIRAYMAEISKSE